MKILLSNDDGYFCEGLLRLAAALSRNHDVRISAPSRERSGAGHGLTFNSQLRWSVVNEGELRLSDGTPVRVPCNSIDGTPADAVKFAIEHIYRDEKFDMVISGVNTVLNVGSDVIYSGTFGAAEEGTVLGVPSVAVSVDASKGSGYDTAVRFVTDNLNNLRALSRPLVTLNVNIPADEKIAGVICAPLGMRRYKDWYVPEAEGFRLTGYPLDTSKEREITDCKMSDSGYITVTPVKVLATDEDGLKKIKQAEWLL